MSRSLLLLNGTEVEQLLSMEQCIDLMSEALTAYSAGGAVQPVRSVTHTGTGSLFTMPAYLKDPPALAVKLITLFPGNRDAGLESHQGLIALFDVATGRAMALIDAPSVTALRTAAVSGLATRLLANAEAGDLAILGTGVQARSHLDAMFAVRPIRRVRVWNPVHSDATSFSRQEGTRLGIEIEPCPDVAATVRGADVICTVTASPDPVLSGVWLAPGVHVNAVGAHSAATRELDTSAITQASVWVDSREAASVEAGDILIPIAEGVIGESHVRGEIGELAAGTVIGRSAPDENTIFKSVGLAVEDAAAAAWLYNRALELGTGTEAQFSG